MQLLEKLHNGRLFFDGGYGTSLQARGLAPGELPELWNITHPDEIINLHLAYLKAGSDIITTNTFGANALKFSGKDGMPTLDSVVSSAFRCAKEAVSLCGEKDKYIALDIGPLGKLLKPLGDLAFEDAVSLFAKTIKLGVQHGVDLILIETMNDSYETKAAVLAAKENADLPVFVTNAYDESGKLMTGATPEAMVALLEGLQVDALGINCSLGPENMLPVVETLVAKSSTPVIVNPNAGLPMMRDGRTVFEVTPEAFAKAMEKIACTGATILGGCCGTTPEHIRAMHERVKNLPYKAITAKNITVASSYTQALYLNENPILIGERINPTGKPLFKAALREKNYDYVLQEAVAQQEAGAHMLDVNVGLPEIDECAVLPHCVALMQAVTDLPLQIDTADPVAMEAALRIYNGKPFINSVNGKKEVMDAVFPLAAKYGGVVIALTLDESGIPETADGRMAIAEKIVKEAATYGIEPHNLIFDPLAMTISSDSSSALVTLECIKRLHAMGLKTSLGVSNVSFGLPNRENINAAFFTMAMQAGLSAAIMNPHAKGMLDAYYAFCALSDLDPQCTSYIAYAAEQKEDKILAQAKAEPASYDQTLQRAIIKGLKDEASLTAKKLLEEKDAMTVINDCIIPALNIIGTDFEQKKAFLPQLLMSAEAAKSAFDVIKVQLANSGNTRVKKFKIVIATVEGDIHDIGKNIVKTLLENYDYHVLDLGKDVPPEVIVEAAKKESAVLVGLSALMTTTVPSMAKTIELLKAEYPACKVMVGGAVLTQEYANMSGADYYAKDAMEAVRYAESLHA